MGWFDFAADPFPCPYLPSFIMVNVYKSTNTWYLSVLISVVIVELRFFFFFTRITFFKIQRLIYDPTIHIRLNAPTFTGVDMYILLQMDPYRSRAIFFFFSMPKNLTVLPFLDFGHHGVFNGAKPTSQCTNITFNTRVSIKFYFIFFHCHICFPSLTFFSSAWWAVAVI